MRTRTQNGRDGQAADGRGRCPMKSIDHLMPKMDCTHCGKCCGVVSCPGAEFDRVREYARRHGIEPRRQGLDCPWLHDGRCAVYPVRPYVCAMYGHVPGMRCPEVHNPQIAPTLERQLLKRLGADVRRTGIRFLHEAVCTLDELERMVRIDVNETSVPVGLMVNGKPMGRPSPKGYGAALQMSSVDRMRDLVLVDEGGWAT